MRPMRDEPELLVPVSEAEKQQAPTPAPVPRWVVVLTRIWIVLALLAAWVVLLGNGTIKAALVTIGVFVIIWNVVAWIFRPALPRNDKQR